MFDKAIIDTDRFMDLTMSSKALYFLLGMEADDEGFVSYKKVIRVHGGNNDDIKILTAKGFLIMFESGVVVITDWNKNNWLDKRRIVPTQHQLEKEMLVINVQKEYSLSNGSAMAKHLLRENRIEENSIEENRIEQKHNLAYARLLTEGKNTKEFQDKYLMSKDEVIDVAEQLVNYVTSTGKKYKDYKATMHNWIKRKSADNNKSKKSPEVLVLSGKVIN